MPRRVLVIGAHSADFVWRAGGAVAVATRNGGTAQVIALSYGERGESGELWKQPDQTIENVKEVRHAEAEKAAAALGAEFKALDFGDYPLEVGPERFTQVVDAIREFAPDVADHPHRHRSLQPRPPGRLRGRRARPLDRRRRRRGQRVRLDHAARAASCSSPTSPSCATSCRPRSSTSRR